MKILSDIALLYRRKIVETLRNPIFLFMGITIPFLYLTLFAPLLKSFVSSKGFPTDNVLDVFLPGMLSLIALFGGLFAGFGMIDEFRSGIVERFRSSPSSRFAILAGPVLRDVTATICQCALFVLISLPFGFRASLPGLLLLFVLLSMLTTIASAFSNAIGLVVKSEDKLAPIVQGMNLPIMLLSGMLLPLSFAPAWLKVLAHFNPVYYVVEAARLLSSGQIFSATVGYAFLIMTALTLLTLRWATKVFSKAVY